MIKILLAEDQNMLRGALTTLLNMETDFNVMKEVSDGREALDFLQTHKPHIALLDIEMPTLTGLDVLKWMREKEMDTKVIILTTFSKRHYIKEALSHRVDGYLLKDTPSTELANYIREVVNNHKQVITPSIMNQFLFEEQHNPLSKREVALLQHVEKGMTTKQIAEALYLSQGTIRNYLSEILQKLEKQNRTEAAFYARNKGWLD
ncbi:transcriptional regulator [Pontibacillus halophilus JSM 076056 = DSM 19796]|uniref:Transcriptional regulator n=1 Tax=Pontibacillus halophilus JSM 076056 = DSM 19796 TaxID=1385510 RepID=A0A0A5GLL2_9BACI|nr:response regulator transcription factor [Pontibacillus halophilus]KGX92113.1 transcriptional regulator [Pontibacillus halophilus JSM 076056 = DSM 19796]